MYFSTSSFWINLHVYCHTVRPCRFILWCVWFLQFISGGNYTPESYFGRTPVKSKFINNRIWCLSFLFHHLKRDTVKAASTFSLSWPLTQFQLPRHVSISDINSHLFISPSAYPPPLISFHASVSHENPLTDVKSKQIAYIFCADTVYFTVKMFTFAQFGSFSIIVSFTCTE